MTIHDYPDFWDDLTKPQAVEYFDAYVAAHPTRLRASLDFLTDLGLQREQLDFSRASLDTAWAAALASLPTIPSVPETIARSDIPAWAAFRLAFAERIGRDLVETVTLIAAYFAESVLRSDPPGYWELGSKKNQDGFRQPLLVFPAGAQMSVEDTISTTLLRAKEGEGHAAERAASPAGLRYLYDLRMKIDHEQPVGESFAEDRSLFEVHPDGPNRFHVTFGPEVDAQSSAVLDQMVDDLRSQAGFKSAVREDDDVLLVETSTQTHPEVLRRLNVTYQRIVDSIRK